MIKRVKVKLNFEHAKPNPRINKTFRQQPRQMLIKECDIRSKAKRKYLKSSIEKENIKVIGIRTPALNKFLKDKNMQTLIREIDGKEHELRTVKDKHP